MKKIILPAVALVVIAAPVLIFLFVKSPTMHIGTFVFTGNETLIDLIAAFTNALNGALLARRPDHYKNFTVVGIVLFAVMGGIGGGVARDVICGQVPSALINPAYITLCLIAGIIGYYVAYGKGQIFREGFFQFMTAFSLPWYAIVGAQTGVNLHFPILGCLLLAVVGATTGRYLIDISCGVSPKQFVHGEWFVVTAIITAIIWLVCNSLGLPAAASVIIAFGIGFSFRLIALYTASEEPLAKEPADAYKPDDGRPKLGRKLKKESVREMESIDVNPSELKNKDSKKNPHRET